MSKKKSKQKQTKKAESKVEQGNSRKVALISATLVVVAAAVLTAWWLSSSAGAPDLQRLVGRWARTDGTYTIEVQSVAEDGTVEAAYYNPRSIHVARANVSVEDSVPQLFIELQDVGYPGSTYALQYDAENDVLVGIYSQAAMHQEFQVAFVRAK